MSKIFFSANLSNGDSSLVNFFKACSKFSSIDDGKAAKFTTQYEFDTTKTYYNYTFTSLPISKAVFPRGELTVVTTKNNHKDAVDWIELKIGFDSKKSRDSLCNELANLLRKCSLVDFSSLENAPAEFYVGIHNNTTDRSIIIAETPEEFYHVALVLYYFH
ncbi:MAG: hypothetical protein QM791_09700 [Ferruginibacter sp.]